MDNEKVHVTLPVQGMTCTGRERNVTDALEKASAENAKTDFRRGQATFDISADQLEHAKEAVNESGYQAGEVEMQSEEQAVSSNKSSDYDLLIIGYGGAAFSAAIKAVEKGAKGKME